MTPTATRPPARLPRTPDAYRVLLHVREHGPSAPAVLRATYSPRAVHSATHGVFALRRDARTGLLHLTTRGRELLAITGLTLDRSYRRTYRRPVAGSTLAALRDLDAGGVALPLARLAALSRHGLVERCDAGWRVSARGREVLDADGKPWRVRSVSCVRVIGWAPENGVRDAAR